MSTENELKELMRLVKDLKEHGCTQDHYALESRLRALLTELEEAREEAALWKHVLQVIGAQTQLGRANFVVVGLDAPMNVMRGSVAEHFTKAIDAARKGEA